MNGHTLPAEMSGIKSSLPQTDKLKTDFNASHLHVGKVLVKAKAHFRASAEELYRLRFSRRSSPHICFRAAAAKSTVSYTHLGYFTAYGVHISLAGIADKTIHQHAGDTY